MKEADIAFNDLYAIAPYGNGGEVQCMVVRRKCPPKPGASRSRMYQCSDPGSDRTIKYDASKILMPWSEYEKTAEYAERHLATVKDAMDRSVRAAAERWAVTVRDLVVASLGADPNAYVSGILFGAGSTDLSLNAIAERVMVGHVTTNYQTILQMTGAPLPSTAAIQEAIDERDAVVGQAIRNSLPQRITALEAEWDELCGIPTTLWEFGTWIAHNLPNLVRDLTSAQVDGPHRLLVEIAKKQPGNQFLKTVAAESAQFNYLIQHLDYLDGP